MAKTHEGASAASKWRYNDDAPPVRPPSKKRILGALLVYMALVVGVAAMILWPTSSQVMAFSDFKIPPNPFQALVAAAPPSVPQLLPASSAPVVAVKGKPANTNATMSTESPRQVSKTVTAPAPIPVPVVAPDSRVMSSEPVPTKPSTQAGTNTSQTQIPVRPQVQNQNGQQTGTTKGQQPGTTPTKVTHKKDQEQTGTTSDERKKAREERRKEKQETGTTSGTGTQPGPVTQPGPTTKPDDPTTKSGSDTKTGDDTNKGDGTGSSDGTGGNSGTQPAPEPTTAQN